MLVTTRFGIFVTGGTDGRLGTLLARSADGFRCIASKYIAPGGGAGGAANSASMLTSLIEGSDGTCFTAADKMLPAWS